MSLAISPSSDKPYGVARVCRVWGTARSTLYRHRLPPAPSTARAIARSGRGCVTAACDPRCGACCA